MGGSQEIKLTIVFYCIYCHLPIFKIHIAFDDDEMGVNIVKKKNHMNLKSTCQRKFIYFLIMFDQVQDDKGTKHWFSFSTNNNAS